MTKSRRFRKKAARKTIKNSEIATGVQWVVRWGTLNAGRGAAGRVKRLFRVVGEKLPFEAIGKVDRHLRDLQIEREGVYVAHDSMEYARYIGRGRIFHRLSACQKKHIEIMYFSFYVVTAKKHEREIETLLIHSAGPLLQFNTRKKSAILSAGSIQDYEAGTEFFERCPTKKEKLRPKRRRRAIH